VSGQRSEKQIALLIADAAVGGVASFLISGALLDRSSRLDIAPAAPL
jgi:hypothetical protein